MKAIIGDIIHTAEAMRDIIHAAEVIVDIVHAAEAKRDNVHVHISLILLKNKKYFL